MFRKSAHAWRTYLKAALFLFALLVVVPALGVAPETMGWLEGPA